MRTPPRWPTTYQGDAYATDYANDQLGEDAEYGISQVKVTGEESTAPTAADTEPRTRCVATMLAAIGLPVFNEELIDLTVRGFQAINAPRFYPEPHDTADDRNR